MFNGARNLTCQTLWLLFLFQYKSVSKPCITNTPSGYNDLFSSWSSESWSPFSPSGLDLEDFIVYIILVSLTFCVKQFIDFGFQVSLWNLEFVVGQTQGWPGCRVYSFTNGEIKVNVTKQMMIVPNKKSLLPWKCRIGYWDICSKKTTSQGTKLPCSM